MYNTGIVFPRELYIVKVLPCELLMLLKKSQFCSEKKNPTELVGAVPVICSSACFSIQVYSVSFLFQAVFGYESTKHGNFTGVQTNCKSSSAPPVCIVL